MSAATTKLALVAPILGLTMAWSGTASALSEDEGAPEGCDAASGPGIARFDQSCDQAFIAAADLFADDEVSLELMGKLNVDESFFVEDGVNDRFSIDDGSIDATPGNAGDVVGFYGATSKLTGKQARRLTRFVAQRLPRDWAWNAGGNVRDLLKGPIEISFFDTAGDPTQVPAENLVFQLAMPGKRAADSVRPTIPETSPLMGSQYLATFGRFPSDAGVRDFAALSNFDGAVGPDGRTAYYNMPPNILGIATPGGVIMVTPATLDPHRLVRPMVFNAASNTWDMVRGPGGPLSFVSRPGRTPLVDPIFGEVDPVAVALNHQAIEGQTFELGGQLQDDITLPSRETFLFGSDILAALEPPPRLTLSLTKDGQPLVFPALEVVRLSEDDPLFALQHGLTGYGTYCLEGLGLDVEPGMQWSDGTLITTEDIEALTRSIHHGFVGGLGTTCWQVGEQEGFLGAAALRAFFNLEGFDPFPPGDIEDTYAEAARLLTDLGFERDPNGGWVLPALE